MALKDPHKTATQSGYMLATIIVVVMGLAFAGAVAMGALNNARQSSSHSKSDEVQHVVKVAAASLMNEARQNTPDASTDEPLAFTVCVDDASACPTNGGMVPENYGGPLQDPYGKRLGYCAWSWNGELDDETGYTDSGTYAEEDFTDTPLLAVISAGEDGIFSTTCVTHAAENMPQGDDELFLVTLGNRGVFDMDGLESYPECEAGTLPAWTQAEGWECREVVLDTDGDGNVDEGEDLTLQRSINCARCGDITCEEGETTDMPLLYNPNTETCVAP